MATNGQLIRKVAQGESLLESEIQQLERSADLWDKVSTIVNGVARPDAGFRFENLQAGSIESDIPVTRGVTYSFITNNTIATSTYTDISFDDTGTRGYIKPSDACVIFKSGSTNKFVRNPIVPANQSILMIGEVSWDYYSGGVLSFFNANLDSYVDGVYDASFYSVIALTNGYFTHTVVAHTVIADNEYYTLNVYQDTGVNNIIQSCNLTFCLV